MKKTIWIISAIVVVVLIVGVCVFVFQPDVPEEEKTFDILGVATKAELVEGCTGNGIAYSVEDNTAYVGNVQLFGKEADVEFYMTDDVVDEISVYYALFLPDWDEETDTEISEYQFTAQDQADIQSAFDVIKAGFEQYIGCSFQAYDAIPIKSAEDMEKNEEQFYSGAFLKEYSVRDRNGVLWLLRYEASYGSASAVLYKQVDETGFEGFIPAIDLTKK